MTNETEAQRIKDEAAYPKRKRIGFIKQIAILVMSAVVVLTLHNIDTGFLGNEKLQAVIAMGVVCLMIVTFAMVVVDIWTARNVTVGDVGSVDTPRNCMGCDAPFKLTPYTKFRIVLECDGHSFEAVGYCGRCVNRIRIWEGARLNQSA